MIHKIKPPTYSLDSLEPSIDAATMDIHLNKHHQGYADKLNDLIQTINHPVLNKAKLNELLTKDFPITPEQQVKLRNFAGGVANHNFYWSILTPFSSKPSGPIVEAITASYENVTEFKLSFFEAASTLFGSGWAWIVATPHPQKPKVEIMALPNQDSPITHHKIPLVAIDVWEHAYYLNYQNRRLDYIKAFWTLIDWDKVNRLYRTAKKPSLVA